MSYQMQIFLYFSLFSCYQFSYFLVIKLIHVDIYDAGVRIAFIDLLLFCLSIQHI